MPVECTDYQERLSFISLLADSPRSTQKPCFSTVKFFAIWISSQMSEKSMPIALIFIRHSKNNPIEGLFLSLKFLDDTQRDLFDFLSVFYHSLGKGKNIFDSIEHKVHSPEYHHEWNPDEEEGECKTEIEKVERANHRTKVRSYFSFSLSGSCTGWGVSVFSDEGGVDTSSV